MIPIHFEYLLKQIVLPFQTKWWVIENNLTFGLKKSDYHCESIHPLRVHNPVCGKGVLHQNNGEKWLINYVYFITGSKEFLSVFIDSEAEYAYYLSFSFALLIFSDFYYLFTLGQNKFATCQRAWTKIGCFHDSLSPRPLPEMLLNDRDVRYSKYHQPGYRLNWDKWHESLHR